MICNECSAKIPDGYKFCGRCGSPTPPEPVVEEIPVQEPEPLPPARAITARLVLVKGEGFEGITYQLSGSEHSLGRIDGTVLFPEDRFLSPKHAMLFYENDKLFIRDDGSKNGVFLKLQDPVALKDGDCFLAGEQLLRFDDSHTYKAMDLSSESNQEDTQFYGCPQEEEILFRVTHLFRNQEEGAVFYSTSSSMGIGREQSDLSFPFDRHISGRHARVYQENSQCFLQDLGSKNGTFYRISESQELKDGDYFFVGQQLIRVEIQQNNV